MNGGKVVRALRLAHRVKACTRTLHWGRVCRTGRRGRRCVGEGTAIRRPEALLAVMIPFPSLRVMLEQQLRLVKVKAAFVINVDLRLYPPTPPKIHLQTAFVIATDERRNPLV